ncbi:putative PGG domain-containing protein [Helianthus debilis subsp. tardiflorus]
MLHVTRDSLWLLHVTQSAKRCNAWQKEEVEGILAPCYLERKNNDGLLPRELFTQDHKDLMSASEKWMKDTASHCMVVSALIATIVFAAAFTTPGGYKQDTGVPVFLHRKAFIVFAISDAISLIFAISSLLMFLYILTSRYAEEDFLESLPKKLMRGLASLFLSIVAMMVAFSASFFVLYHNNLIWVPYVITTFASLPVILYARHEHGLLIDVYNSTYRSKDIFKPKKPMLY